MRPSRFILLLLLCSSLARAVGPVSAQPSPAAAPAQEPAIAVDDQPLVFQSLRLIDALAYVGAPLDAATTKSLRQAFADLAARHGGTADPAAPRPHKQIQAALDPLCLAVVECARAGPPTGSPGAIRLSARAGSARPELTGGGWRAFLVKVINQADTTLELKASSPSSSPVFGGVDPWYAPDAAHGSGTTVTARESRERWADVSMFNGRPLAPGLGGLEVEYRIVEIYAKDAGKLKARLDFTLAEPAPAAAPAIGFSAPTSPAPTPTPPPASNTAGIEIEFDSLASTEVIFDIRDGAAALGSDKDPLAASFVIRDDVGRVYPYTGKRLSPDFFFHDQVYRYDGESVELPSGHYTVVYGRGPEYREGRLELEIPSAPGGAESAKPPPVRVAVPLERWVDPAARGYFSGDHHIHSAGCLHYRTPSEGVGPPVILRNLAGEGLNVGLALVWGQGWTAQKEHFSGRVSSLSSAARVMRYDIEVSGFPSSHMGHLALLGLKTIQYPGAREIADWPSWNLPILKWARAQGAVAGAPHSGWGLDVFPVAELPNQAPPPMDGIGAHEFIVDLALGQMDFISTHNSPYVWELNMWYHALNCGFRLPTAGETDFPCMLGDRVGVGRTYVKMTDLKSDFLPDSSSPDEVFARWLAGLKAGRSYVSDGLSHIFNFRAEAQTQSVESGGEIKLDAPGNIRVRADVAALLPVEPARVVRRGIRPRPLQADEVVALHPKEPCGVASASNPATVPIRDLPYNEIPYWSLERARVGATRRVAVEAVVNSRAVARREIEADGSVASVEFDLAIPASAWVALRVLPSSHANPIYVCVGGKPVRASRADAQWMIDGLEQVWKSKGGLVRPAERADARAAFDAARRVYEAIRGESPAPSSQ